MTKEMGSNRRHNVISDAMRHLWVLSMNNAVTLPSTLKKLRARASLYQKSFSDVEGN
jgi:hypothetical protein